MLGSPRISLDMIAGVTCMVVVFHVLLVGIHVLVAVLLLPNDGVVFAVPNLKSSLECRLPNLKSSLDNECRLQCLQNVLLGCSLEAVHVSMLLSVSAVAILALFVLIAPLFEGPICGGEVGIDVPAVVGRAAVPA
jgi:hypothetical protein